MEGWTDGRGLCVEDAQYHDTGHSEGDGPVMLPRQLLLEEDPAPEDGQGAVGGDDGRGEASVGRVAQGVDVGELARRLEDAAQEFGALGLHGQLVPLDGQDDSANDAIDKPTVNRKKDESEP